MSSVPPCEAIPFIDDSGSSSCASSLGGDASPRPPGEDEEDAASLNRLLDDAASGELSLSGLHEDYFPLTDLPSGPEDTGGTYSSVASSPVASNRTSSHSSIKSSDAVDDSEGSGAPLLPLQLPPCATCEAYTCSSSSSSSCTTCALEADPPVGGDSQDDSSKAPLSPQSSISSVIQVVKSPEPPTSHQLTSISGEIDPLEPCLTEDAPVVPNGLIVLEEERTVPKLDSSSEVSYSVLSAEEVPILGGVSTPLDESTPSDAATPVDVSNSVPPSGGPQLHAPHHYISSLRVASMRGAADMGGALVARVATFLRSQYKSSVGTPVIIAWCPRFKLLVNDFESSLVQIPLAPHLKVPTGQATIPSILAPQVQMSVNEAVVEDRPRRVLVEGEPGYCNANICFRMAYDWALSPPETYMVGFSLVFVMTLRDFRGGSLFSYMCKEILPRHILSREAMNTLWAHLRKVEDKVLFLLVGFDELCEEEMGDLWDLIEGRTFPLASVVLTSRTGSCKKLPSSLHRRFLITGLNHIQTSSFMHKYFRALGHPDCGKEVMALVEASQEKYGELPRCPIMCLALGVLYEDLGGKLPSRLTDFFMALIKHMVRRNLQRRGEPMCYGVLPDKYIRLLQDFGRLALESLKGGSPYFTGADLKIKVPHGGEIVSLGLLLRMRSMSKLTKRENYAPAHVSLLEFAAAFYLSGLAPSYSQLQGELDSLAEALDLSNVATRNTSGMMILRYLVGLLGRNASLVFNVVSQMGVSQRLFFLLLKESGMAQMNVIEVCKHLAGREHVVIATNSPELEDWGRLLYSPDCSLEGVEVLLDFDAACRERHESFFTSLSFNESVKSIKLTCLLGGDFGESEVTRLVAFVRAVLTKRRLESFEMVVTSVEETTKSQTLRPVLDMICDTLPDHAQTLDRLVLAMDLDGEQVTRLCDVLVAAPQVKVLHLPHLSCGFDGLEAVARLVKKNPLVSLNLSGSLSIGTPIDDRCVWTGAGSPSSSPRETPSPLAFWSFVDAKGVSRPVFHSLPRSFYLSIPRRARLHSATMEKRDSTSLLQKSSPFPPPKCFPEQHLSGFHQILSAFRSDVCRVCHLNLSKCTLSAEDLVCLGETLRKSRSLSSLRMEGLTRVAELVPVLIALEENQSLQLLDLTSSHILVGDAAFQVIINAFRKNRGLRFLVLNGWTLQLESERSLTDFLSFLSSTELQHLDLTGGQVKITALEGPLARLSRQDDILAVLQEGVPDLANTSLAFLNLDHFEVSINEVTLRGHQLMFLLRHLPKLVDASLTSHPGSDVIDDSTALRLFSLLPASFPCLRRLCLSGWVFSLDNCEKVMRMSGKYLRRSHLREVELAGVQVREWSGRVEMEHLLLSALTTNLHHLSLLSLSGLSLSPHQMALFGKVLKEKLPSKELELEMKGVSYACIKSLRQAVTEGGRCDLVFEGGPSSVYRIRKKERKENMLAMWACINTLERLSHDS